MPLPARDTTWPPPASEAHASQLAEWGALWEGHPDKLATTSRTGRYWQQFAEKAARTNETDTRRRIHAAIAGDIVTTSADLLFGEAVGIHIVDPAPADVADPNTDTDDGTETGETDPGQAHLDELRDNLDLDGVLLEAAEIAAALGGVWLRPVWDDDVADHPLVTVHDPRYVIPEYRLRKLIAVTFWEVLPNASADDKTTVWRHLERHELVTVRDDEGRRVGQEARIQHALYVGVDGKLGDRQPLTAHADTAGFAVDPTLAAEEQGYVTVAGRNLDVLLPVYMPNVLPNHRARNEPRGRSDFDGIGDELDAVDEVWNSLLRDVRLSKARIYAPESALSRKGDGGPGSGRSFDEDQEIVVELDMAPDDKGSRVALVQGQVRAADHLATIRGLVEQAVNGAGYAPATFGLGIDGAAESGTARAIRERKTFRTLRRKRRYAERAVADLVYRLLLLDQLLFSGTVDPVRPRIEWPDLTADPDGVATRLVALRTAQAISVENAVREAQPDLDEPGVKAEVARILTEGAAPDPFSYGADVPSADTLDAPAEVDPAVMREKFEAMGAAIRSGVEPEDAAKSVGLDVRFTGAVPVTLRQPAADAAKLEEA